MTAVRAIDARRGPTPDALALALRDVALAFNKARPAAQPVTLIQGEGRHLARALAAVRKGVRP